MGVLLRFVTPAVILLLLPRVHLHERVCAWRALHHLRMEAHMALGAAARLCSCVSSELGMMLRAFPFPGGSGYKGSSGAAAVCRHLVRVHTQDVQTVSCRYARLMLLLTD